MHMDWNRASLRICSRLDEVHATVQGSIRQRLGCNLHLLSLTNLRQLFLVDIGLDPYLIEICDREQCVARIHILPLRHLAIDNGSRGIDGDVRNSTFFRRVRLLATDTPKFKLVLACFDKRIGLRTRGGIV